MQSISKNMNHNINKCIQKMILSRALKKVITDIANFTYTKFLNYFFENFRWV